MKIIIGLGNPGKQYTGTRHNAGFMVVELLSRRWGLAGKHLPKFNAMGAEGNFQGEKVLLIQPLTFMNLSGQTVRAVMDYYKLTPGDLLVVYDEAALPLGQIRYRGQGSAGGHNGLSSVIQHLGTQVFPRLRLGIGPIMGDMVGFVLGRFNSQEESEKDIMIETAADAVECWLQKGGDEVMNRYNKRLDPPASAAI